MATSLAQQLKKLALPESTINVQEKKKISLLFDPKEAASIDRETFFEIGLSGLVELSNIDVTFNDFKNNLFNINSKDFERSVQTKDANKKLNKVIKKFLIKLSPYFLLQSSHRALEWLINRYKIHEYNKDEFMSLILPYHESKIFVRCLQTMKFNDPTSRWHWLQPLQKPGVSLAKIVLFNHCASNPSLLNFISDLTMEAIKVFGDKAHLLTTIFAFYCSTVVGALEHTKVIREPHVTNILPGLLTSFASPLNDFKAAGYMIAGQLVSKTKLKRNIVAHLVNKIFLCNTSLHHEAVLLLHLIYQTQEINFKISTESLANITTGHMKVLCLNLNLLVSGGSDISKLLKAFMAGILTAMQKDTENLKLFAKLPEMAITEISMSAQCAEIIIQCVLDCYVGKPKPAMDDSDVIEISEEDNSNNSTADTIQAWYSEFLRTLEKCYPSEFDKILKHELRSNSSVSDERRAALNNILGFAPKIVSKLGDSFLFEKLYHQNPDMRKQAVKYIISSFKVLQKSDANFLKDSIVDRLSDDDPEVVTLVLSLKPEILLPLLTKDVLINRLKSILSMGLKEASWWEPAAIALDYICSFEGSELDIAIWLSVLPYLFPRDVKAASATLAIIKSPLGGTLFPNSKNAKQLAKMNPEDVCKKMFSMLEQGSWLGNTDDIMKMMNSLNESDYNCKMFAIILLSFSIESDEPETNLPILRHVLNFVENLNMQRVHGVTDLSGESIIKFIDLSNEDKLPLQCLTYFIGQVIKKTKVTKPQNNWIDFADKNSSTKFIVELYEILMIRCSESASKFFSPLLQAYFISNHSTTKDKLEFIANFIYEFRMQPDDRRIVQQQRVFQVRSIRLLKVLLDNGNENIDWMFSSQVIMISLILCLGSPERTIRCTALEIIKIVTSRCKTSHYNVELFNELLSRQEEIQLDHEQLSIILYTLLSPDPAVCSLLSKPLQKSMKNALNSLIKAIENISTPHHVKCNLIRELTLINSADILDVYSKIALDILEDVNEDNCVTDYYRSQTYCHILKKIDASFLLPCLQNKFLWNLIEKSLQKLHHTLTLSDEKDKFVSSLMLQTIDKSVFATLPLDKARTLISLIVSAGTFGSNMAIISSASKTMKKIDLHSKHLIPELKAMQSIDVASNQPKSKPNSKRPQKTAPSLMILDTAPWKRGVTLLEYIQNKKDLGGVEELLPLLFGILKKCLEFEEQLAVEYVKQLLLTAILHCCQTICPVDDREEKKFPKNLVDIELIVKCIRGTRNPQTHHHALMLLSHAAFMLPDQVLHHIMAIFTFIGSSVLRHDDAYSFQIITRIIETVIPILVRCEDSNNISEAEVARMEKQVVPVLRIFVDVVLDIPEHRRLPLFKKLMQTLNANHFLWIFLCLIFEGHIMHGHEERVNVDVSQKKIADKEQPVRRLDFAMSLVMEFSSDIIMQSCINLIKYLKTLPADKEDKEKGEKQIEKNPAVIFSLIQHNAKHLRHYKYTMITFINNIFSSPQFIQQLNMADKTAMESLYKAFIVNILTYIQEISKTADQNFGKPQAKYWKVMLHHSYEILDNVNTLLSPEMFTMVVRGLMSHNLSTVRRKSMELLNTKLQHQAAFFIDCDRKILHCLLQPICNMISKIESDEIPADMTKQELELNQQTALLSLKLLVRLMAPDDPNTFIPILELITGLTKSTLSNNLMATIVLCLAELCSNLKAHSIAYLPKFMPSLIKILKVQNKVDTPELVLLSVITAVYKIVETIPLFLSPYLEKLLFEFSILSAKWESNESNEKTSPIVTKLTLIKSKISSTIAPRVLIPVVNQCYALLIKKQKYNAIGPVMNVLAESFVGVSGPEFTSLQQDLTAFFLTALQFRSDREDDEDISPELINTVESHVIKALVALILKLSESSFRPLYFKIFDWAVRSPSQKKERTITFYRLSSCIAENLKGLFVLFAGHFIKNASDLLDATNTSKNEKLYFASDDKNTILIESILKTLHCVFMYDCQNFVNKERFETIMQPLVDQLENSLGGLAALQQRARSLLIPCITQFAVATADDSLWKPLNYQILLKTRNNESTIRLLGLDSMTEMASKLGDSWLPLLPESVPFLAELLEDEDKAVEAATQKSVQVLETVLGEPLQKYF